MKTISCFASHGASSFRILYETLIRGSREYQVGLLISNNKCSEALNWAKQNNLRCLYINAQTHPIEEFRVNAKIAALREANTDYIVLSGYMRKLPIEVIENYKNRIVNIHPSLLPKYGGKGMYGDNVHRAVLNARERLTGASLHFVTPEYDEGPVILQESIEIKVSDDINSLRKKVKTLEGQLICKFFREK